MHKVTCFASKTKYGQGYIDIFSRTFVSYNCCTTAKQIKRCNLQSTWLVW